jgi:hypothetical protein
VKIRPGGDSPFFRAMVVMGSSLAVGCGGTTRDEGMGNSGDGATGGGAQPGTAASGAGGTASTSPVRGSGGSVVTPPVSSGSAGTPPVSTMGAGGSISLTDAAPPNVGAGGSGAGGDIIGRYRLFGDAGPDAALVSCPSEQWRCRLDSLSCNGSGVGWRYGTGDCACDPKLPLSPRDCAVGDRFVCQAFAQGPEGAIVPFDCSCMPGTASCDYTCANLSSANAPNVACVADNGDNYLCGCAVILLK